MLTVAFMKWTDPRPVGWRVNHSYTIEHVLRARSMVDRHLRNIPHRFVLATDEVDEVVQGHDFGSGAHDTIVPLPKSLLKLGHRWPKLALFAPNARKLFGERVLYMDLDVVVLGNMDRLITQHDFRIMGPTVEIAGMHYNSSMILLTTGRRDEVWNRFEPSTAERVCAEAGVSASDQFWIAKVLGRGEATWMEKDGVTWFRRVMAASEPPHGTKVVFFPGPHDPSMPGLQASYPWIKDHWR